MMQVEGIDTGILIGMYKGSGKEHAKLSDDLGLRV